MFKISEVDYISAEYDNIQYCQPASYRHRKKKTKLHTQSKLNIIFLVELKSVEENEKIITEEKGKLCFFCHYLFYIQEMCLVRRNRISLKHIYKEKSDMSLPSIQSGQ